MATIQVITIDGLLQPYETHLRYEKKASQATVIAYCSDLNDLAVAHDGRTIASIDANDLARYIGRLTAAGQAATTIIRKIAAFSSFWKWCVRHGYATENVAASVDTPKKPIRVPRWMPIEDLRAFVYTPVVRQNDFLTRRDGLAWKLLAWLGLRRGELLNLTVPDVRLHEMSVIIRQSKGDKDRVLPLPTALHDPIDKWIEDRRTGYLVPSQTGGIWSESGFKSSFYGHLTTCKLSDKGYTPHTLRHTFATHLANAGVPLPELQALLGHADIKSTMIYVHVNMIQLRAALEKHVLNER